uniref:Uncharacterized protein n=1 Tax=Physcomitrium patens TaxID=3218 RepID=A0A2K1JYX9_PHYPA|nr:hypothetical protein PHYPA_013840 [Physcomitrium patens]
MHKEPEEDEITSHTQNKKSKLPPLLPTALVLLHYTGTPSLLQSQNEFVRPRYTSCN